MREQIQIIHWTHIIYASLVQCQYVIGLKRLSTKDLKKHLLLLLHEFTEIGRQNLNNQKLQHYLGFGDMGRTIGIQQCLKIWTPPHCCTLTNLQN
jgi:hypothetical protein